MPSFDLFAITGVVLVLILLAVLFLMPTEKRQRKAKRAQQEPPQKDWQAVSLKLEKHIYALRQEIAEAQKKEKKSEHQLMVEQEKYRRLQEKLSQEREWRDKEKHDLEKRTGEVMKLLADLKAAEQSLAQEHAKTLALERDLQTLKGEISSRNESQRSLEAQIARLDAQCDNYRKQIGELRTENAKLNQKHEETTFIAKSEYQKVERKLRETEQEFQKFKEKIKREGV